MVTKIDLFSFAKIETKADGSYMVVAGLDDDRPAHHDSNTGRPVRFEAVCSVVTVPGPSGLYL